MQLLVVLVGRRRWGKGAVVVSQHQGMQSDVDPVTVTGLSPDQLLQR
jgi:hypothetical protein